MQTYKYNVIKSQLVELFASGVKDGLEHPNDYTDTDGLNYWWVSDRHTAVIIPHDLIGPAGSTDVDLAVVMNRLQPLENPILFTLNEFRGALGKCSSESDYDETTKECEACDGTGDCQCKCGDEHPCSVCNGEGEIVIEKKPNGRLRYNARTDGSDEVIKIGIAFFDPNKISLIGNGIKLMGLKDNIIQLTHNTELGASVFQVGDVRFLLMPKVETSDQKFQVKAHLPYLSTSNF
jgi:hypothetical protein